MQSDVYLFHRFTAQIHLFLLLDSYKPICVRYTTLMGQNFFILYKFGPHIVTICLAEMPGQIGPYQTIGNRRDDVRPLKLPRRNVDCMDVAAPRR